MPRFAILLIACVALASACSSSDGSDSADKYTQTWPKSYANTTCDDWNHELTDAQQWAAAADMLTGARNKGDGGEGLPPDSLVDEFQNGVTTACVVPTMSLAEVGANLYLTDRERFRPQTLVPYVAAGRRAGASPAHTGRARRTGTSGGGPSADDVRSWAREHGHTFSGRGRIAASVREAYDAAH